ncbi:MAG: RNA-binding protein [Pirellulales bacterium]|nr:RNA-binding protein [Pirellulales bacterium]
MGRRIYVGNLAWSVASADLQQLFGQYGNVRTAEVVSDRQTGQSRGFGFVEMESNEATDEAIRALNGQQFQGRPLTVNEAQPKAPRAGGGGYGGGGGGGGYGGGGGGGGRGGYGGGGGGGRGGYGGGGGRRG